MQSVILNLNYLAVFVTALVGFLVGWLWYSPVLFAKAWKREMKITDAQMQAAMRQGMAVLFGRAFVYTFLSTFGLAALLRLRGTTYWLHGAEFGLFVGLFVVSMRMLNGSLWEQRSLKLQAINIGHELVLFTLQGTILVVWI